MAAPIDSFVQLPTEASTFDKKVRSQTRVVGSNTVNEHYYTTLTSHGQTNMYFASSGVITPPTIQDQPGSNTARFWLVNPALAPGVKMYIRSIKYSMGTIGLGTAEPLVVRLAFALFTCTGLPSAAATVVSRLDSFAPLPVGQLVLLNTGLTITLGNMVRADLWPTVTAATGVGAATPFISPERSLGAQMGWDECPVLRPGEGLVCYCPEASTASNTRRGTVDVIWEEAQNF